VSHLSSVLVLIFTICKVNSVLNQFFQGLEASFTNGQQLSITKFTGYVVNEGKGCCYLSIYQHDSDFIIPAFLNLAALLEKEGGLISCTMMANICIPTIRWFTDAYVSNIEPLVLYQAYTNMSTYLDKL
jgi:hypothetical protein